MQEYFEGKNTANINEIKECDHIDSMKFINQRPDKAFDKKNLTIKNTTFASLGLKESKIKESSITHSVFINCYFNRTVFDRVDLTGCKFINCKFENPIFVGCDIKYIVFEDCYVKYEEIKNTLPVPHSYRWRICTNLAMESLNAGDSEQYRKFFFQEKKASEEHYFNMFTKTDAFYKKKYETWESVIGISKYIISRLSYYVWGYGEKLFNLIVSMIVIIILFAMCMYTYLNGESSIFKCVHISISQFLNIKGNEALTFIQNANLESWALVEGILGIVFIGFFISALFRSINRR